MTNTITNVHTFVPNRSADVLTANGLQALNYQYCFGALQLDCMYHSIILLPADSIYVAVKCNFQKRRKKETTHAQPVRYATRQQSTRVSNLKHASAVPAD